MADLVIRAHRVVTPDGIIAATVLVTDGKITAIDDLTAPATGPELLLAADEALLPGLVDTHVHVNDPGRSEWEGFETATRAAAAGGITTIVDMPLNSLPSTVNLDALATKRATATGRIYTDVGLWGGAIPGNLADLTPLHEAGVFGFKCFLLNSGVDEFPPLDVAELEAAMRVIASFDGLLIVHAEDEHTIDAAPAAAGRHYRDFLASRPAAAELTAIERVIELAEKTGVRAHILHLSAADALEPIAKAKARGVRVTVETCPHYLSFAAERIPDGATEFKCCPPIRDDANRERLWAAVESGLIDCVVSDHSPCTPELKRFDTGDYGQAWGGIAGLQVGFNAVWTQARARGIALDVVVKWCASQPADLVGLTNKGRISVGADADFSVFAPDEAHQVHVAQLKHRNAVSAYDRMELVGKVRRTFLRGKEILDDSPHGNVLEKR
jgi:allantoinase